MKKAREAFAIVKTSELADEESLAALREWFAGK
jgi:hypothetical protein